MEHRITAAVDGHVTSVAVSVGDQVVAGEVLVVVTEPDETLPSDPEPA